MRVDSLIIYEKLLGEIRASRFSFTKAEKGLLEGICSAVFEEEQLVSA